MSNIPINLYNYCKSVSSVQIYRGEVILNQSINVEVVMFDENGNFIDRIYVLIEGENYNNWMNDDDLINLVLTELGMSRKTVELLTTISLENMV